MEAAALALEHIDFAAARFNTIKRLCQFKCLTSYIKILEHEALQLCAQSLSTLEIYNDTGDWFPSLDDVSMGSLEDLFLEQMKVQYPDRTTRRKALRKMLNENGRLNKKFRAELLQSNELSHQVINRFPISPNLIQPAFEAYLETGSSVEIISALKTSLADISNLSVWYKKEWDRISPISMFLREIGINLTKSFETAALEIKQMKVEQMELGVDEFLISRVVNKSISEVALKLPNNLALQLAHSLDFDLVTNPNWAMSPSIMAMALTAGCVGKKTVLSDRPGKISDFGDISHSVYLPHVDVFRADGFTTSLIKESKFPINTLVVGKLLELPEAIEDLLIKQIN